jgi:hypothetical protein
MQPDLQDDEEFDRRFRLFGICFYLSQLVTILMSGAALFPLIIDERSPYFAFFQSDQGAIATATIWCVCLLSIGLTLFFQLCTLKVSVSRWWRMRPRSSAFLFASLLSQVLLAIPVVAWLWLPVYFVLVRKLGHVPPPLVSQAQVAGLIDPKANQKGKSAARKSVKDWTGQK